MKLMDRWRGSHLHMLFNLQDDLAKGRVSLMLHSALGSIITCMTTGLFYTSFLMANGIDLVNINIITFVPYIAGCFTIFAPSILERFAKRKWLLAGGRLFSFTLTLLGVTIMPKLVSDPQLKMVLFVLLVFTASLVDNTITGGFSVWHLKFQPEHIRADFISINTLITQFLGLGAGLISGIVADALSGSPYEDTIIVALRYAAYGLAVLNFFVLVWPKEFPYEKTRETPRVRDVFVLPMRHRKFILTMGLVFLWTFFLNAPGSTFNYYLLNNVGVSYSFINVINMLYPLFLLLFLPFWKRYLRRIGWWKTFAWAALLHAPTTILYSCVTADNYLWLMTVVRLIQHFLGVGMNVAYENVCYLNMPYTDQTNYMSFRNFTINAASFLGAMAGTWFVAAFPDICITLFGMDFINAQLLQWVHAFGQLLIPVLALVFLKHIDPEDPRRRFA